MRLLEHVSGGDFRLTQDIFEHIPRYAILSHTWGLDDNEVTFRDLVEGTGKHKAGYEKIRFCGREAARDGLRYFWVDTCCIDKSSSSELSEAINSMFRWYRDANQCYVYLADVSVSDSCENGQISQSAWEPAFRNSTWFARGWTLQELIAPVSVSFFSREGERLGDKKSLERQIHEITGVDAGALQGISPLSNYDAQERMSWAVNRKTKLQEDKAYSLLGIFGVYMPIIYGEGENAFIRLQEQIEKSAIGPSQTLLIPSSTVPFRRDPDFVDGRSMLTQINQKCAVPGSSTALVGLGGIGKSQLAIEYSYRIREQSRETWVFWVHASNAARFEQGYQEIADKLNIPGRRDPKANILELVRDWLQEKTKGKWILVLDNIDDADFLFDTPSSVRAAQKAGADIPNSQPIKTYLPQSENGSTLITTRSRKAALSLVEAGDIIEIRPMDWEGAVTLFQKHLAMSDDEEAVGELVTALEFMPLAIVQAAAYISQRTPRRSVHQYLEEFLASDRKKTSLLNYDAGYFRRDLGSANAVLKTWQISFDHVQEVRPSAANVLSFMSFFDRQGIPGALIRTKTRKLHRREWSDDRDSDEDETESNNDEEFELDIQTLRDHSLISISVNGATFGMHALVQLATKKWLEAHGQLESWKRQYIEHLSEEFPTGEYENWEKCGSLFPHAQVAVKEQPEEGDSLRQWSTLLYNVAWYAWRRGILADAENMSVKSMEARRSLLGLEHADTQSSMAMVALVYKHSGRWEEAENLEVQVMETRKGLLGPQHPNTLTSMGNLASTYRNQGRWDEAEELEVEVMETRMRELGSEHPDTLASMTNLASTYWNQGRWGAAEDLAVQAMETSMRVLGSEHPDTLTSIANLASTYRNQGRWMQGEELEKQVMETRLRVLGTEHPDTLTAMANLASTFRYQGRWMEAEELDLQVMEAFKRVLGTEHPSTLTSMANLASTYTNQGRWTEAEELDLQVMETFKRVLGTEHPSTLTSMANLASTYTKQGRWTEAELLGIQVTEVSKRVLGAEHPSTLTSMANLASTYTKQGRWREAEELGLQVTEVSKRVLGAEHPSTLTSMANLASTYRNEGRWKEAEALEVQLMETRKTLLGDDHPTTLTSAANLASTYRNQSRWKEAEHLYVQVMETRVRVLGAEHPSTLTSMANLSLTWKEQGRYVEALTLMEECVRLRTKVLGVSHHDTMSSMTTLVRWKTEDQDLATLTAEGAVQ